ncbi:hypothetical protein [Limnoglobus roseus]|uniref:HEAT repeat domain-containing protein n=1 Tax=Limnoglobus roseus TaxID=2598579 RepID=A0A5C1AF61_9BACT|nr:hypothetical protein [Limnoglobus roseus]QEL15774.1 hypothetical protein PX52LOC_02710 [Limnoglobus roseus]
MKAAKLLMTAAASAVLAGTANAQLGGLGAPALPGASPFGNSAPSSVLNGVSPPPPLGLGTGPGAQLPGSMNTIWSRLGISQEQREFCKRKICRTPAGQLLGRIQAPISTLSGGVIPPFCPIVPSVAELLDPGVVGAASKAKLDRAGAEERIKAVKYLGTLDCHYWPEAEEALIGALRGDRNECVRYEAAVALSKGCCCTCKVIVALSHVVSCSDADGFPYEKSARVRAVAANALDRCMASCNCSCAALPCLPGMDPVAEVEKKDDKKSDVEKKTDVEKSKDEKDKEKKDAEKKDKKDTKLGDPDYPKVYYAKVARMPRDQIGAFGQKALEIGANIGYTVVGEVNPRDYAAAGMVTTRDGQSTGAKPSTLWELMTWKDNDGSIGKPIIAPPAAYASRPVLVPASPAPTAIVTATPVSVPTATVTTAPVRPSTTPAPVVPMRSPVPAAVASRTTGTSDVPIMTMPSSAARPVSSAVANEPRPLVIPTLNPTPMAPVATITPTPAAKPLPAKVAVPVSTPVPVVTVPVAPPAAKPMPAPVPAKLAPVPPPTLPTLTAPAPTLPAITIPAPAAVKAPEIKPTEPAINLPPVERMDPATPVSDLPPVEKMPG